MVRVYKACDACAYLIHAMEPPSNSASKAGEGAIHYVVNLEPVGVPLLSQYGDNKPRTQEDLKSCIKYGCSCGKSLLFVSWPYVEFCTAFWHSVLSSVACLHICHCPLRCVALGVQKLHSANYGHTDIHWENIIRCGQAYILIDLEFACKLDQLPFTPQGPHVAFSWNPLLVHAMRFVPLFLGQWLHACSLGVSRYRWLSCHEFVA